GALLWFVPRASLRLTTPEDAAATYLINRHIIRHRFCPTCGIHPYGEGVDPKGNAMAAVNLRCIEGLDLEAIPVRHFDGRSL
ncbi:MAG: GFA family protein, partial [Ottowia sp.]|nr:GFA family protein [Ottowia sp.]